MKLSCLRRHRILAFTLVELLVVITIIALMAGLSFPAMSRAIAKAQSMKCAANLRQIGVCVTLAAADNNNTYPQIDQAGATIYPPPGTVGGLVSVLGPYGVLTNTIQCPIDMGLGANSAFTLYGSSYEWTPIFDDESLNAPVIYVTPTKGIPMHNTRVRLCSDFNRVHLGWANTLWGDGHVSSH